MRLILNAQTAGEGPQPIWLSSGQSLTVGRTEDAQFVIATDLLMSRVHFEVAVEGEECRIADRGSSNGTLLNRERIREARLKDGDQIQAGHTLFLVRLEPTIAPQSPPKSAPPAEPPRPRFIKTECSSGVVQVQLKKRLPQPIAKATENQAITSSVTSSVEDENETAMPGVAPSWSESGANSSRTNIDERRTMEMYPDGFSTPVEEFPRPEREVAHVKPGTVAVLQIVSGGEIGRALRVEMGQSFSVGRLEQNDFAFPNEQAMSGRHFQIEFNSGELVVYDLGSRNGTFVNGIPCKRAVLCDGDRLMVGDAVFQVRFEGILDGERSSQFVETVTEVS